MDRWTAAQPEAREAAAIPQPPPPGTRIRDWPSPPAPWPADCAYGCQEQLAHRQLAVHRYGSLRVLKPPQRQRQSP